jgi:hypothetical protein
MGKKSLIKSTSKKKKTTSKPKDEDKKSKMAKKKDTAKGKAGQKVETKKIPAAKKTASDKDLIFKKFDREIPEELFKVEEVESKYTSPPFISTTDDKEADRIKKLLFKKIDLTSPPEEIQAPEEVKKSVEDQPVEDQKLEKPVEDKMDKKADYKEIIGRKFYQAPSPEILAASPHKRIETSKDSFTAPSFISDTDDKEADRIKKLLFKKIDLTSPPEEIQAPEEVKEPVEEVKQPLQKKEVLPIVEEKEVIKADYKEIIARKFYEPQPVKMMSEEKKEEYFTAPPFISADDPEEVSRLREILSRQFEIPPVPDQPSVQPVEEKEPEKIVPETILEAEELAAGVKEEKITPDLEKIEAENNEKEDESPKVTVSYDEPPPTKTEVSDPMDRMLKFVAAGVVFILLLLIVYSFNNKKNYYIKPDKDGIEIWQGRFAPMGEELLARLEGVAPPENIKDVYKAEEVLPVAFAYFVDKADNLLNAKGTPDLHAIRNTLEKALSFALTNNDREKVYYRLDSMEKHVLQYRANVAASRGTPQDIGIAINLLSDALKLDMDEQQKSMIQSRIEYLKEYRNQLIGIESPAQPDEIQVEENDAVQEKAVEQEPAENEVVDVEESDKPQESSH